MDFLTETGRLANSGITISLERYMKSWVSPNVFSAFLTGLCGALWVHALSARIIIRFLDTRLI